MWKGPGNRLTLHQSPTVQGLDASRWTRTRFWIDSARQHSQLAQQRLKRRALPQSFGRPASTPCPQDGADDLAPGPTRVANPGPTR